MNIAVSHLKRYHFCPRSFFYFQKEKNSDSTIYRRENFADSLETAKKMILKGNKNIVPKFSEKYFVESSKIGLKGVVDIIVDYESHVNLYLLRTNYSPREGIYLPHKIQLAAYLMILEESRNVNKCYVIYKNGIKELIINEFLRSIVLDLRDKVRESTGMKELPSRIRNKRKCRHCPYERECYQKL